MSVCVFVWEDYYCSAALSKGKKKKDNAEEGVARIYYTDPPKSFSLN